MRTPSSLQGCYSFMRDHCLPCRKEVSPSLLHSAFPSPVEQLLWPVHDSRLVSPCGCFSVISSSRGRVSVISRVAPLPLAGWRSVTIGLAGVLWCSRCDPTTCFAQILVGLACARHGATKANCFCLLSTWTHLPCIAVCHSWADPLCTGLVLETGVTWSEPALGSAPQGAQSCLQHAVCTQGWMLWGALCWSEAWGTVGQ